MDKPKRWKYAAVNRATYFAWRSMRYRCTNPNSQAYKNYGGRGIGVSDDWLNNFDKFFEDMGPCPEGLTLERLDNDKGYSKENCAWVPVKQNNNNRRSSVRITFQGQTKTIAEWAEDLRLKSDTLWKRLYARGLPLEKALTSLFLNPVWRHGTRTGYELHKCRCAECRESNNARARNYRQNKQKQGEEA